jgi:hypothetical protein
MKMPRKVAYLRMQNKVEYSLATLQNGVIIPVQVKVEVMSIDDMKNLENAFMRSQDNRETDVTLLGNKYTIIQVVTLLSYIRNAIRNNEKKTIEVSIGNNVSNRDFEFLVNNQKTDDMNVKEKIEIN